MLSGAYADLVRRRRELRHPDYKTLADVDFDGDWITPFQIISRSLDGPVLVAHHWSDAETIEANRSAITGRGYLPTSPFNRVIDRALEMLGWTRTQLYVTQAFHLLPLHERCARIPASLIDESFDAVTRYELVGRRVIALGRAAAAACRRHGVLHIETPHPSARRKLFDERARVLAEALKP